MNNFINKTVILRPFTKGFSVDGGNVSGIVKGEIFNNKTSITLIAINFAPLSKGKYCLILSDKNKNMQSFDLCNPPSREKLNEDCHINIENGFAALIVFADKNIITPVAFGTVLTGIIKITEFTKFYAEKYKKEFKQQKERTNDILFEKEECGNYSENSREGNNYAIGENNNQGKQCLDNKQKEIASTSPYNDEEVATENYYHEGNLIFPEETDLSQLIDKENFKSANEDEQPFNEEKKSEYISCENAFGEIADENQTKKEEICHCNLYNEKQNNTCTSEEGQFLKSIAHKLKEIFEKYPQEKNLSDVVPDSYWAKINISADNFYVVGAIMDNGKIGNIAYGVPGIKDNKPKGFESYSVFLPSTIFENQSESGYWCMFQNADDGSIIK